MYPSPENFTPAPADSSAVLLEIAFLLEEATRHLTLLAHELEDYEAARIAQTDPQFAANTAAVMETALNHAARRR